jgi:DNA replication and repair protein RecF
MHLDTPVNRTILSSESIIDGFQKALINIRSEEIIRGQTTIGPHRDDVSFVANGINLGTYGSRGQIRTTMLSMKLAEILWIQGKTGHWPVLLLDEVLAELDPQRREDLLTRLAESEQVLLTTTDLDLFTLEFAQEAKLWHVGGGRVKTSANFDNQN